MAYDSSYAPTAPALMPAPFGVEDKMIAASDNIAAETPEETIQRRASFINRFETEDAALAYLADVLVEAYLEQRRKL